LEVLLKEQGSDQSVTSPSLFESLSHPLDSLDGDPNLSLPQGKPSTGYSMNFSTLPITTPSHSDSDVDFITDNFAPISDTIVAGANPLADQSFSYISDIREGGTTTSPTPGMEVIWPNWPPNVPRPSLLRHL